MADEVKKGHESDSDNSDSEEVYTIQELNEMCATADAVLGASDPNNCSYSLGYVKRQALYACMTCNGTPDSTKGGVCLACANNCHENHQLVELYTKRSFRCDCGNKKFETPCQLQPEKDATNVGNSYNHNFVGLYCSCERPYPDLEHPENDDEMIQCIVCEDWFHSKHAFGYRAEDLIMGDGKEEECEMICQKCTESCDFLKNYCHLRVSVKRVSEHVSESGTNAAVNPKEGEEKDAEGTLKDPKEELKLESNQVLPSISDAKTSELKSENDVESRAGPSGSSSPTSLSAFVDHICGSSSSSQKTVDSGIALTELDGSSDNKESESSHATKKDTNDCILKNYPKGQLPNTATLWISGWRAQLCKCERCMNMYFKLGVSYIVDENDTLDAYEALGQAKREEEEKEDDAELTNMWSKLDHVAKVEAMISINEMKEHMREFLSKYNGKVFRKRDAEEFAEELKAKRARRMNSPGDGIPPSSCR